jgi:prophage regulatory protein
MGRGTNASASSSKPTKGDTVQPLVDPPPEVTAAPTPTPTPTSAASPLLLDIATLASMTGWSVDTLRRYLSAGRLPAPLRIGGSVRWRADDVRAWVAWGCPPRSEFEARRQQGK